MTSPGEPVPAARVVVESGVEVRLPSGGFRLAESPGYRPLSGQSLKEIDVGWWDTGRDRLVLLELKGREVWDAPPPASPHQHLVEVCAQKAGDTLLMLCAAWLGTGSGAALRPTLPPEARSYPGDGRVKVVFLIDVPEGKRELLIALRDELNARLRGKLALFGIRVVTVVNLETAQKMGLPVQRHGAPPTYGTS